MWLRKIILVVTLSVSLGAWAEMPLPAAPAGAAPAAPAAGAPPPSFASAPTSTPAYPPAVTSPQVTAAQMEQLRNNCSLEQAGGPTVGRGGRSGGPYTH